MICEMELIWVRFSVICTHETTCRDVAQMNVVSMRLFNVFFLD
jgi:hypothetical protein